jgi:hypothetical protein
MGLKEKKYQLLQICKWNSYSMLLKVLGTISYQIIGATYALVFFQWFESLHWWDNAKICSCQPFSSNYMVHLRRY